MTYFLISLILVSYIAINVLSSSNFDNLEQYITARNELIEDDKSRSLGCDVVLTDKELKANKIIMSIKTEELDRGFEDPNNFTVAHHYFQRINQISQSKLFKMLKKMPKGAVLHSHDGGLVTSQFFVDVTYYDHLWQCDVELSAKKFKFSIEKPTIDSCQWLLVKDERNRLGNRTYDAEIIKQFEFYTESPYTDYPNNDVAWVKFFQILDASEGLISYRPVWEEYFKSALSNYFADGIQYIEIRGSPMNLHELNGTVHTKLEHIELYKKILNEFSEENPTFIGVKFIFQVPRFLIAEKHKEYLADLNEMILHHPDFVVGFDIAGHETQGPYAIDLIDFLLSIPSDVKFFFHAGETNWFGTSVDENLIDAILLGTTRIGHGLALAKHPELLKLIKERAIPIEVNPVSNHVLTFIDDFRNHPCSVLFSNDYPVVISSDDYGIWNTDPLSHDYYMAFLGIAAKWQDLKLLKKLAMNSIKYSAMNESEKAIAMVKWTVEWDKFIDEIVSETDDAVGRNVNIALITMGLIFLRILNF